MDIFNDNGKRVTRVKKRGIQGFQPYDSNYIATLRKDLKLTAADGVNSRSFYGDRGLDEVTSMLVDAGSEVIKRLAKT